MQASANLSTGFSRWESALPNHAQPSGENQNEFARNVFLNEGTKSTMRCHLCDLPSLIVPSMLGATVACSFSLSLISHHSASVPRHTPS